MNLMEDHLPADQRELALRWDKRYPQPDHEVRYSTEIPYDYRIICYGVDVYHTKVLDDLLSEIKEKDRKYLEEGRIRGLTVYLNSKGSPEEIGGSYICVTVFPDLITGDLTVTNVYCSGEGYEKLEKVWKALEKHE